VYLILATLKPVFLEFVLPNPLIATTATFVLRMFVLPTALAWPLALTICFLVLVLILAILLPAILLKDVSLLLLTVMTVTHVLLIIVRPVFAPTLLFALLLTFATLKFAMKAIVPLFLTYVMTVTHAPMILVMLLEFLPSVTSSLLFVTLLMLATLLFAKMDPVLLSLLTVMMTMFALLMLVNLWMRSTTALTPCSLATTTLRKFSFIYLFIYDDSRFCGVI
jgi:hypothetical protein